MEGKICFIDFEATGLNLVKDYPIEIGAVLVDENLSLIKGFQSYIKPPGKFKIESASFSVHGITEEVILKSPPETYVLETFFNDFGTDYRLAAWNMSFDLSFFKLLCYRNSFEETFEKINYRHIDVQTISLIGKKLGCIPETITSLTDLLTYFGIKRSKFHSAKEDAELLYQAYIGLLNRLDKLKTL